MGDFVSETAGVYSRPTFAADFREFKMMLTHICATVGGICVSTSGHLSGIGIHVPQSSTVIAFTRADSEIALLALRRFVGHRPITNAQGFSRPFVI